jgi:hypothetical protein
MKFLTILILHFFFVSIYSRDLKSLDPHVSFSDNNDGYRSQILDISNGNWSILSKGLFDNIKVVSIVLLDHNHFISLPTRTFPSLIIAVDLSYNQLEFLPDDLVYCPHGESGLVWLNLGHNKLRYFNISFDCLVSFRYLLLNNNEILDIDSVVVHFKTNFDDKDLRIIDLDNNSRNKTDTSIVVLIHFIVIFCLKIPIV